MPLGIMLRLPATQIQNMRTMPMTTQAVSIVLRMTMSMIPLPSPVMTTSGSPRISMIGLAGLR
jgi:hypothetical protein